MRFQPEDEDVDFAWNSRETHSARMEFLETLPDDALNCLVESNFWPHFPEKVQLLQVVYSHPGLTMLTAMSHYAESPANYLGSGDDKLEGPEVVELLLGLRDKLNDFAFVDVVGKYQHFSSPLKVFLRDNSEQKYGRFALSPAVIQYGRDAMEGKQWESDRARYSVDGDTLTSKEMVKALLGAVEDPVSESSGTKLGRASTWLRKNVLGR